MLLWVCHLTSWQKFSNKKGITNILHTLTLDWIIYLFHKFNLNN